MKKLIALLIALCLISSMGQAQKAVKAWGHKNLFATTACTLGGVQSDFVNNPNNANDSTFAWSEVIDFTFLDRQGNIRFADRAWLEISITDTNKVTGALAGKNDTLVAFMYAVGPNNTDSDNIIDTLVFVYSTVKGKSEICEVTPMTNSFVNGGLTRYKITDLSLLTSDCTAVYFDKIPYQAKFLLTGDCSTATYTRANPYLGKFNDTLIFQARLIMEAN